MRGTGRGFNDNGSGRGSGLARGIASARGRGYGGAWPPTKRPRIEYKGDPSSRYIENPSGCPKVQEAHRFFNHHLRALPDGKNKCRTFVVKVGPVEGWRTEAKLAVRDGGAEKEPLIGLFNPGSHDICPGTGADCKVHHPAINDALRLVARACRKVGVRGYDGSLDEGDLRYLQLDVERSTQLVQLTLVWHATCLDDAGEQLTQLTEKLQKSEIWHSIWVNFHKPSKHCSRILAFEQEAWVLLAGKKSPLREKLTTLPLPYDGPRLCFPPNVFRQANLDAFEAIVAAVRLFVPQNSSAIELYGGVGTIGLHLSDLVKSLECSDENPNNAKCFRRAIKDLPEEYQSRLSYVQGDATAQAPTIPTADILIVDPPRKGLNDEVVAELLKQGNTLPHRVIYVSCGFKAFVTDAERLLQGEWNIRHCAGYVLFPGSDHLETLCVFDRKGSETEAWLEATANPAKKKKHHRGKKKPKGQQQEHAAEVSPRTKQSVQSSTDSKESGKPTSAKVAASESTKRKRES